MITSKDIWDFIHTSYQNHDFDNFKYISGLGIISIDNYYLVGYYPDNQKVLTFKISIDHNIIKSTSTHTIDCVEFGYYYPISGRSESEINEELYNKLLPVIRDIRLKEIGV